VTRAFGRSITAARRGHSERQYTCLHHVSNRLTNNATIRERFGFDNVTKASRLLADAVDDGRVRNPELGRRYAEYVPYWA
jgi:hypothetical protein